MDQDFSTPDTFGVRVGGLPVAALDEMRSPALWRGVDAVLDGDERLTARAAELSDALFEVIGRTAEGRPALVALRRALHNRKPLTDRIWNDSVRALLPAAVIEGVHALLRLREELGRDRARLAELVEHHARTRHTALRKAVCDPAFRHGLVLSSPDLHAELCRWLSRPEETVPDRRLALRLTKYLSRITLKTTPFSTFTVSGLGTWRDGPVTEPARPVVRTVAELNVWVVQQFVRELSRHPALAPGIRLRLSPAALRTGDRWEFLGPGPDEPLRGLAASPPVLACVDAVAGGRTRAEAARRVAELTGGTREAATAYLDRLVDLGLLEAERPFPDQDPDPLGALRAWVAGAGPALAGLEAELVALVERVAAYPGLADPEDRLACVRDVEAALRRVAGLVGAEGVALPAKNSMVENALLVPPSTALDRRAWEPVLRDLDVVRRLHGVLDPAQPGRVALADLFAERVGPGAALPFPAFHRTVQGWVREDPGLLDVLSVTTHGYRALAGHRLPRIRELVRLRAELCAEVLDGRPDADGVLRPAPGPLAARADGWPSWLRPPDSVTYYGQPLGDPAEPGFVLNAVNSGHGRGRDRIRRLLAQAGAAADADTAPPPDGVIVADTCRHYGSNVGLRCSAVADEIDVPGGWSRRPEEHRIPLSDLEVRHDPEAGLLVLWSRARGAEVRPVHPNLIAEMWLPPALRLLMQVFGATSNLLIPGRRIFGDTSPSLVRELRTEPRVVVGRTVVSRRQWVFPAGAVPVRRPGEGDAAYLTRLAGWLRGHGMPRRCFVRALDPGAVADGSVWRVKDRKPLAVDFANLLLVGLFERMLAEPDHVLFLQEALPDASGLPDLGDGAPRVTEYLIEINGDRHADR
ncbi:lantibiotic dehydratase [Streptomyces sp. URMC 126]|uniref:lantibiotic dehydratase n=1 Tax=Streptomyces sp. URMC 126 TaxID=3423401 RepID=UPI003F1CA22C